MLVMDLKKYPINSFPENGFANAGKILDQDLCYKLRSFINKNRPINNKIFYKTEMEFQKKGRYKNYAPGIGHNFIENCDTNFIENNEGFKDFCSSVIGKKYSILKKSIIRSTPSRFVPSWIKNKIKDIGRPNLNPYIRDEYQDVQYFLCTDFHQDKTRQTSEFVTIYIYLDDVDAKDSALNILVGSHQIGFTSYPHNLRQSLDSHKEWFYNDNLGNFKKCKEITVTGKSGSVICFHNLTLHGTCYNNQKNPRISLRYLLKNDTRESTLYKQSDKFIFGKKTIDKPQLDVANDGSIIPTGSSLNFMINE